MRTIDIHAHLTPHCLLDALEQGTDLYGIDPRQIARGRLRDIDAAQRVADMDRMGVDVHVISCEPQIYCYQYDASSTIPLHRECNDEISAMSREHPDRLSGLAVLPMQDIDAAIAELDRCVNTLGFKGAMIGDHVNGTLYDDPSFTPFWAAAEQLGAVILLHQSSPTVTKQRIDRYHLSNTVGNPVERTLDFAALVFGGVMDRFPDLKICLAHGGGYTCFAVGRMDWGWRWRPEARVNISQPPSAYLSRFYYDCITHSEAALRFLIDSVGVDRVVFGSDYPGFAAGRQGEHYQPREWLIGLQGITEEEKVAILGGNLEHVLDLHPAHSGDIEG
jgi:aminocarboxymuconate-semialdehyde decarboxylase